MNQPLNVAFVGVVVDGGVRLHIGDVIEISRMADHLRETGGSFKFVASGGKA